MSDKLQLTEQSERWQELRDDRGKLLARLEPNHMLLEIRRNHDTVIFDLRDYTDYLRDYIENLGLAIEENMC